MVYTKLLRGKERAGDILKSLINTNLKRICTNGPFVTIRLRFVSIRVLPLRRHAPPISPCTRSKSGIQLDIDRRVYAADTGGAGWSDAIDRIGFIYYKMGYKNTCASTTFGKQMANS